MASNSRDGDRVLEIFAPTEVAGSALASFEIGCLRPKSCPDEWSVRIGRKKENASTSKARGAN